MFGTCDCCGDLTAAVRLWSTRWGFTPFRNGFDTVYTVGTGFNVTAMTIGMLCKRVNAGVVTGVYEAKGTFTASSDPSTDTTNWRHAGLTATAGESNYWYNCDPILKYTIAAKFTVGTGWQSAAALGFGGNRPDHSLNFSVGALATRDNSGTLTHYRCTSAIDRTSDPTAGDPSTDTSHWQAYSGARSLWLDFTQPPLAGYSSPFNTHRTPTKRYSTWRETTEVFLDDVSQGTKTREFSRDNLSGIITTNQDDYTSTWSLSMPSFTAGPSPAGSGTFPPSDDPASYMGEHRYFDRHYHQASVATLDLSNLVYPDSSLAYSYSKTTYGSRGSRVRADSWGSLNYSETAGSGSGNLSLTSLTQTDTTVEFTWTGANIPWWQEFDLVCAAWSTTTLLATGSGDNTTYYWWLDSLIGYTNGVNYDPGTNTVHNAALKVVQTIELLDEITDADHVADCISLLPAYPSFGFVEDYRLDNTGTVYLDGTGSGSFLEAWVNLYLNGLATFGGVSDTRLSENEIALVKVSANLNTTPHWTLEQTQGSAATETEYATAGTHAFAPTDNTLKAVKITTTDPSP